MSTTNQIDIPRSFWYNPSLPLEQRIIETHGLSHFDLLTEQPEIFGIDIDLHSIQKLLTVSELCLIINDNGWVRANKDSFLVNNTFLHGFSLQGKLEFILSSVRQLNKIFPIEVILIDTMNRIEACRKDFRIIYGSELKFWLKTGNHSLLTMV